MSNTETTPTSQHIGLVLYNSPLVQHSQQLEGPLQPHTYTILLFLLYPVLPQPIEGDTCYPFHVS